MFAKKYVNILKLLKNCADLSNTSYGITFLLHHPKKLVLSVTNSRSVVTLPNGCSGCM